MSGGAFPRAALLALAIGLCAARAPAQEPAAGDWRPFTATWTLAGGRSLLPTEGERAAAIVHLTGPLAITSGEALGRGLLGEVIGFDDGRKLLVGRAVFTDERGDRIFCILEAEPIGAGRRATAMITGGTGHFAGLEGTFSFAWQYAVETEGGEVGIRTTDVVGRTRRGPSSHGAGRP